MERMFPWYGKDGSVSTSLFACVLNAIHLAAYTAIVALVVKAVV